MSWNAQTNRDVLKGIVALLFALAELADRASLASHPIRCHVLGILRQAEAIVQAFVISMARDFGAPMPPQACLAICAQMFVPDGHHRGNNHGDDPADAVRLGLNLRVLALALASLSARAERSACYDFGHAVMVAQTLQKLLPLAGRRSLRLLTHAPPSRGAQQCSPLAHRATCPCHNRTA